MKRDSSIVGRLKGVDLRGKRFWFRYNFEGHQHRVHLNTDDEGEALTKALKIRQNPLLAGADSLKEEIDNYLTAKQEEGIYTRNFADTRSSVLHMFASDRGLKESGRSRRTRSTPGFNAFDLSLNIIHIVGIR